MKSLKRWIGAKQPCSHETEQQTEFWGIFLVREDSRRIISHSYQYQ